MKNLDTQLAKKTEIQQRITNAMRSGDEGAFQLAFTEFTDFLQEAVMAEAKGLIQSNDQAILSKRGVRALTSEETEYYQLVTTALRSSNPKQALVDIDKVLPKTVIDAVLEDLTSMHPILEVIDFQNTGIAIEWLASTSSGAAVWGEITSTIASEIAGAFTVVPLTQNKLSAFIPVAKAMLDLGPVWLDRWVRTILTEKLAAGLELGIVDNDGDEGPIGMTRALTGAVDGVYPRKTPVAITSLDAVTYGTILNSLSQGPNGTRRAITEIICVVNPTDYFTKIMPVTTVRAADGTFANNVFPFPTKVIQSASMPINRAIFGLPKKYFMGIGTSKGGKLEYADETRFLEDQRLYLIKLYGTGKPTDAYAFFYADISGLIPYVQEVYVTNDSLEIQPLGDARVASLAIGAKTLSPTFNKSVHVYACATTDATNTITAVAMNGEATIAILNGETPVANGAAATWATGANVLTINVTLGLLTETYTVTVTKS